jgi:chemotaxis protein MotB
MQREGQKQALEKVEEKLQAMVATRPEFARLKDQILIKTTNEGLLIELLEKENSLFFKLGSAQINSTMIPVLRAVAGEIRDLPNPIIIEGHTDSRLYSPLSGYSNWELSTDRAHSARRFLEACGVRSQQITQVRGYADRNLRFPNAPYDVRNRRISLAVMYDFKPAPSDSSEH